ncbi:PEP-CTERM sorting domain-containing protein [Nitrosospira sp. Nsp14]|uniref:PEP-CTERM sorting domain-containing protein n=1 Tax=Nitrosospira sp. Nsp14 TaxID=1855333 RepID=UPI000B890FD6|nr:PEP-CTERM sorting domain-containing protein [Nitrosospira sp. Nsp14]
MKTTHCSTSRRFFLGAALFAGAGFVTQAAAQAQERSYLIDLKSKTLTELRSPDGGQAHATAMNDAGQVVGFSYTPAGDKSAFITGSDGAGVRKIDSLDGSSWANDINSAGQVTGGSGSGAFITGANGAGISILSYFYEAHAINDAGHVVSETSVPNSKYSVAVIAGPGIIGPDGPDGPGIREFGSLGGSSYARDINNTGQVVGYSSPAPDDSFPTGFITGPEGYGMKDIGFGRVAEGINNAGQVVGVTIGGTPFMTGPEGSGERIFDNPGPGEFWGWANEINDAGQAVGSFYTSGDYHAFVTGPEGKGTTDLNSLLELPSGMILREAVDINNAGQLIAIATVVPEPQSYVMLLTGLGLIGFMVRLRRVLI